MPVGISAPHPKVRGASSLTGSLADEELARMRPALRKSAWMRDLPRRDAIEREIRRDILTNGVPYVGVFGSNARAQGETLDLGIGIRRETWLWHFAFGYVSGFPLSAIAYFLLTRCGPKRLQDLVLALERRRNDYDRGFQRRRA